MGRARASKWEMRCREEPRTGRLIAIQKFIMVASGNPIMAKSTSYSSNTGQRRRSTEKGANIRMRRCGACIVQGIERRFVDRRN